MIPEPLVQRARLIGQRLMNCGMVWVINIRERSRYNVDEENGECSFSGVSFQTVGGFYSEV
jgi:hypothetical protein